MRDVWSALGIKKDYKILNRWSSCKTRLDWVLLSQNKQSLSWGQASRFCLWLFVNDIQKPEPKYLQEYLRQSREHIRSELALFTLKPRAPLRRSVLDPWQPRHLAVQLWAPRRFEIISKLPGVNPSYSGLKFVNLKALPPLPSFANVPFPSEWVRGKHLNGGIHNVSMYTVYG